MSVESKVNQESDSFVGRISVKRRRVSCRATVVSCRRLQKIDMMKNTNHASTSCKSDEHYSAVEV